MKSSIAQPPSTCLPNVSVYITDWYRRVETRLSDAFSVSWMTIPGEDWFPGAVGSVGEPPQLPTTAARSHTKERRGARGICAVLGSGLRGMSSSEVTTGIL